MIQITDELRTKLLEQLDRFRSSYELEGYWTSDIEQVTRELKAVPEEVPTYDVFELSPEMRRKAAMLVGMLADTVAAACGMKRYFGPPKPYLPISDLASQTVPPDLIEEVNRRQREKAEEFKDFVDADLAHIYMSGITANLSYIKGEAEAKGNLDVPTLEEYNLALGEYDVKVDEASKGEKKTRKEKSTKRILNDSIHPYQWGDEILSPTEYKRRAIDAVATVARQFGLWLEGWTEGGVKVEGDVSAYREPEAADFGLALRPAHLNFGKPIRLFSAGIAGCEVRVRCMIEVIPPRLSDEDEE
jgi:hypothetical protein